MWRFDRDILTQFDFFSLILIMPLIITSNWLIGEVVPALADKQSAYVGVAFMAFILSFFFPLGVWHG